MLDDLTAELKATKRQRIRDIMKHPENEETLGDLMTKWKLSCKARSTV